MSLRARLEKVALQARAVRVSPIVGAVRCPLAPNRSLAEQENVPFKQRVNEMSGNPFLNGACTQNRCTVCARILANGVCLEGCQQGGAPPP